MITLVVKGIKKKVRGEIKNTLLEIKRDVFVGDPSKRILNILWKKVCEETDGAILVVSNATTNGFYVETHGVLAEKIKKIDEIYLTKY